MSGGLHPEQVDAYRERLEYAAAHLDRAADTPQLHPLTVSRLQGQSFMARLAAQWLDEMRTP